MEKRIFWIISIVVTFLLAGILVGFLSEPYNSTTEIFCECNNVTATTEHECNTLGEANFYFVTGLINIIEECEGSEYYICYADNSFETYEEYECELGVYTGFNRLFKLS